MLFKALTLDIFVFGKFTLTQYPTSLPSGFLRCFIPIPCVLFAAFRYLAFQRGLLLFSSLAFIFPEYRFGMSCPVLTPTIIVIEQKRTIAFSGMVCGRTSNNFPMNDAIN